jgi:hypothetical protein
VGMNNSTEGYSDDANRVEPRKETSYARHKTISTYLEVVAFLLDPDMRRSFSHARQRFLVDALHGPGADVAAVSPRHDLTKIPCVRAISGKIYLRNGKTEDRSLSIAKVMAI